MTQHRFLLSFNNVAQADAVLAASSYATYVPVDEEQQLARIDISGTINGQNCPVYWEEPFLASTVKGLTLPFNFNRSVPYDILGLTGNQSVQFTVDNLTTFKRNRQNWIGFTVNGQNFVARDDAGQDMVPEPGVTLHDFDANGWPLVNKKAVYDPDTGAQISPAEVVPGLFIVMVFKDTNGATPYTDDLRPSPADNTLAEVSVLANDFWTTGTLQTYTRNNSQTDWSGGYTLEYYERTVAGHPVRMIDPLTLPAEIIAQHGVLQGLTGL